MRLFSDKISKFDQQIFIFGTIFTLLLMVEPIVLISQFTKRPGCWFHSLNIWHSALF